MKHFGPDPAEIIAEDRGRLTPEELSGLANFMFACWPAIVSYELSQVSPANPTKQERAAADQEQHDLQVTVFHALKSRMIERRK